MEASALSAPAGLRREAGTSPWLRLRSDEQLVGLFRSGSEDAFRVIHDRYRSRLYVYARQMLGGSGPDAEDVLQDVFLRAYRALRQDQRPVSLRAWLYRVAHNRCIDGLRRPTPAPAEIFEMSRTPIVDPLAEAERREDLRRLIADVRRLPDQQRSALLMREIDGMSYADLAVALETSVPAVKSLLVRARIGLVEAIEARDADCSDIRHDLAASYDRGVRASGRARRHLRDCDHCTNYRAQLRGVRQGFASMTPSPLVPAVFAKLLGLGGAGAGGGAAAGGAGAGSVAIGGAAAVSVSKVAAIVCCAAVVGGGAYEVNKAVTPSIPTAPKPAKRTVAEQVAAPAAAAAAVAAVTSLRGPALPALDHPAAPRSHTEDVAMHPPAVMSPSFAPTREGKNGSGGTAAPDETAAAEVPAAESEPVTTDEDVVITEDGVIILPTDETGEPVTPGGGDSDDDPPSDSGTSGTGSSSSGGNGSTSPGSGEGEATTASTSGSSTSGSGSGSGTAGGSGTGPTGSG